MQIHPKLHALIAVLLMAALLGGCVNNAPATIETTEPEVSATLTEALAEVIIAPNEAPTSTEEPTLAALPPKPQEVKFTNSLGTELSGYYYPAAVNPAPLVVLMHWTNGDMSDWYEVAVWLQNRGLVNPFTNPLEEYWWDESWFPAVPADRSYGVFIFSFSNSKPFPHDPTDEIDTSNWIDDAHQALLAALELEGVDRDQIFLMGASLGADAAADTCITINTESIGTCKGVISLSPTGYIGSGILESFDALGQFDPPVPVLWVINEYEAPPAEALAAIETGHIQQIIVPGINSGLMMIQDGLDPLPMQLILDFLAENVK